MNMELMKSIMKILQEAGRLDLSQKLLELQQSLLEKQHKIDELERKK